MIDAIMNFVAAQGISFAIATRMVEIAYKDLEHWEQRKLWDLYNAALED